MTLYYIDQIRFDDLEQALKKLEEAQGPIKMSRASMDIIQALGGGNPVGAPAMIRYLIKQEQERLSTPRLK